MRRITLTFGLISGTLIVVYTFMVLIIFGDFSNMSVKQFKMLEALGYIRYLILFLTVFLAMRTFLKQSNQPVNYSTIVKQGIMVALLIAVLVGIMEYFYMVLNPGFYEKYGQMYVNQMKQNGASAQTLNEAKQQMENYQWIQTPLMTGIFYFFETALIGSVASLIIGFFVRNIKPILTNKVN